MTDLFEQISVIAVYSAMAVYTFAFIAFTLDLARRSAPAPAAVAATSAGLEEGVGGRTGLLTRLTTDAPADGPAKASRSLRIAMALTVLGFVLHVAAVVLRGIAAGYVPWSNMYGFALTATAIAVGVFIFAQFWQDLRFLGAYIIGFAVVFMGLAATNFYVPIVPQPLALQSVCSSSTSSSRRSAPASSRSGPACRSCNSSRPVARRPVRGRDSCRRCRPQTSSRTSPTA